MATNINKFNQNSYNDIVINNTMLVRSEPRQVEIAVESRLSGEEEEEGTMKKEMLMTAVAEEEEEVAVPRTATLDLGADRSRAVRRAVGSVSSRT